jgi:hypothetical protein
MIILQRVLSRVSDETRRYLLIAATETLGPIDCLGASPNPEIGSVLFALGNVLIEEGKTARWRAIREDAPLCPKPRKDLAC